MLPSISLHDPKLGVSKLRICAWLDDRAEIAIAQTVIIVGSPRFIISSALDDLVA
jgi:hypothetical protein